VREDRAFKQREDPGACLEEIMVPGLGGQIVAWYIERRVLGGGTAHFGGLGREGVLEGAGELTWRV
jgi:hypothetical protein